MEKFTIILKHEYSDDGVHFEEMEAPYEASMNIGEMYEGLRYFKIQAVKELCEGLVMFMEEEKAND